MTSDACRGIHAGLGMRMKGEVRHARESNKRDQGAGVWFDMRGAGNRFQPFGNSSK